MRKTLTPHFTDFFTDFEKKTDCFAVYKLLSLYILNMDRMQLKIEITTLYRLILLPPLSFTEYSQLENFRFGANVGL